jgi:hypothetical protein
MIVGVLAGSVDQFVSVEIWTTADGLPNTTLAYNTSGMSIKYQINNAAVQSVSVGGSPAPASMSAGGSHVDWGFYHIGNGLFQIGLPDALVATNGDRVKVWVEYTDSKSTTAIVQVEAINKNTVALGANTTTPLDAAGTRSAVGLASANLDTQLADIPTVAEFEARTLLASAYFDPTTDTVAHVTLVDTCSVNTDMVSVAGLASQSSVNAIGLVVDAILIDTDDLQTNQGNWLTATGFSTHSAMDVVSEMGNGSFLNAVPWNAAWDSEVQSEVDDALRALNLHQALIAQGAERAVNVDNSHRVHSHVYDMQANTLTASALASDAVTEIQSGLALESSVQDAVTAAESTDTKLSATVIGMFTDLVQMIINDGTANAQWSTKSLELAPVGGAVDLSPVLEKLPETGRALNDNQVRAAINEELEDEKLAIIDIHVNRLTAARAAKLDLLDVAISTIQSQITALNNLSAKANWFGSQLLEIPDTGTRAYLFELVIKDDEDALVNLDSLPTVSLTNAAGTDRSALITTSITNTATGRYSLTITVGTSTTKESLKLTASGTIGASARYAVLAPQVVDYDTATQINQILTTLGTAGSGLTNIGDTRLAKLNDGVPLATTQPSITWQPQTITAGDGTANITLAGSGNADGIAWTRSGSGDPLDQDIVDQLQQGLAKSNELPANFDTLVITDGDIAGTVGGIAGAITTLDDLDTAQDTQHTTTQSAISALNDFDPANDIVARVTLVDTTTTNTDMRGTDNAMLAVSYTAPDNASILLILADTNELQTNQGNWITATSVTVSDKTGFSIAPTGLDLVTAWTTNITGNLSGTVGGIAGTINTLDQLDTAQDLQHSITQSGVHVTSVSSGAVQDIFSTYAIEESYASSGVEGTPAQVLYLTQQAFTDFAITETTISIKGLDGSEIATYVLDNSSVPTSRTRAT